MRCHDHQSQEAVINCAICNKPICRDCVKMYGVSVSDYAGLSLCFECSTQMVAINVEEVTAHKRKTQREIVLMGVGSVIGAVVGFPLLSEPGTGIWFFVLIGLGAGISMLGNAIKAFFDGAYGMMFVYLLGAPIIAIRNLVRRLNQLRQANEIIESDSLVLAEMNDYFAYTQAIEKVYEARDFKALTAKGGKLFNNSYVQKLKTKGEKAAQAELRRGVVQIAANGEIIRNFNSLAYQTRSGKRAA